MTTQAEREESLLVRHVRHADLLSTEEFVRLAQSASRYVRAAVAARPDCPEKILRFFADDLDEGVLGSAAGNPRAPLVTICAALASHSWAARVQACWNPKLPMFCAISVFWHLGWPERLALAVHRNASKEILTLLANLEPNVDPQGSDRNKEIRSIALKRLGLSEPSPVEGK